MCILVRDGDGSLTGMSMWETQSWWGHWYWKLGADNRTAVATILSWRERCFTLKLLAVIVSLGVHLSINEWKDDRILLRMLFQPGSSKFCSWPALPQHSHLRPFPGHSTHHIPAIHSWSASPSEAWACERQERVLLSLLSVTYNAGT